MRVLRISHSAAVDEWRGRERALAELGFDVELLSAPNEKVGGTTVNLVPRPGERVVPVRRWGSHPALFLFDPVPIWRALGREWDILDIHEEPFSLATAEILALRALRRARVPYVLYTAQNLRKRYPIPFRWFERGALRSAAGISACSSGAARIAERKGFPGRARVIALGVDPMEFSIAHDRAADPAESIRVGASDAEIVVGFVGRLVPEKGAALVIDAAARDPRMRVRIAGSGPELTTLRELARDVGLRDRVEFVGALEPASLPDFYRSLDVLAVPSLPTPRWTEQFGRVAVEAMSCGVPVVASDAGALPDVVGGAGIVVPHGDVTALAAAISDAGGPRFAELRAAGFARAEECTWQAVAREYADLYRSARGRRGESSAEPGDLRQPEVIVVAYGHPEMLRVALEPVADMKVTVVDNSSRQDIAALCATLKVRYLDAGHNLGFAGGVNMALDDRLEPGADVLLLNPDARVLRTQIDDLLKVLRAHVDLASVAPAQEDESGSPAQVSWVFPSPLNTWLESLGLSRLRGGPRFVIGSILLLRAEAVEQVGAFDDRFFLYSEETDWAYRASLLGWRHTEVSTVIAHHRGAGTSTDELRREVHFHASQERYFRKHFGAIGWQVARAGVWVGATARAIVLPGERGRRARRRAALYRLGPVRIEQRRYPRGCDA